MWLTVKLSMRQHRAKIGGLMWKVVDGYDNYEVNELGVVRNKYTGKVKSVRCTTTSDRPYANLWKDGVGKNASIGRIVAKAFCDGYKDGLVVDHVDNNPWNNHCTNLRWVTQRFNVERSSIGFRRHKSSCILCVGVCEYPFDSFASASRFASKEYGASYSMLTKWHCWHDITIKCND